MLRRDLLKSVPAFAAGLIFNPINLIANIKPKELPIITVRQVMDMWYAGYASHIFILADNPIDLTGQFRFKLKDYKCVHWDESHKLISLRCTPMDGYDKVIWSITPDEWENLYSQCMPKCELERVKTRDFEIICATVDDDILPLHFNRTVN